MTRKWLWIFLIWHGWRAAVWRATCAACEVSGRDARLAYAKVLAEFHEGHWRGCQHQLFPPPPIDWEKEMQRFKRTGKWNA